MVSVIVPVYNGEREIGRCIDALLSQTYPEELMEIIIIDNGSTDGTCDIVRSFARATLLLEHDVQSSYAARNKGIAYSSGDILAFTDTDCTPREDWIEKGIDCINKGYSLVAGRIVFAISPSRKPSEIYDSLFHMNQQETTKYGVAATANLIVTKSVMETVGIFRSNLISGGDTEWCLRATGKGFAPYYCEKATVQHPARAGIRENLKKARRLGRGRAQSLLMHRSKWRAALETILFFPYRITRHAWQVARAFRLGKIGLLETFGTASIAKIMFSATTLAQIKEILKQ